MNLAEVFRVLAYARSYWLPLIGLSALMLVSAAVSALQPWAMKILIDNVLGTNRPAFAPFMHSLGLDVSQTSLLMIAVSLGLTVFAVNSAIDAVSSWGWTVVGRGMTYKLAQDLFARLQRRSLSYHSRVGVGETMTRVADDCWSIQKLLDFFIFNPAHSLLTLGFVVWLMLQLDSTLTAGLLLISPLVLCASTLAGRSLRATSEEGRTLGGGLRAHVQRTLAGLPLVQAYGQEKRMQAQFVEMAEAGMRTQQRQAWLGAVNALLPGLITTIGGAVVIWACAYQVINGRITLGGLLVFVAYYGTLRTQIAELAKIYPGVQALRPAVGRVNEILTVDPEVSDHPGAVPLPPVSGRVRFEGVGFAYEEGRPTLHDIWIDVAPGEKVALVGPTGAGKSTLVSLIPRFFDPGQGRILIDGHDLRDVQLASLRSQIALVLQDPFLFPISIAENIAYGRPDASAAEVEAAARAANAHDFIMRLPGGYDSLVGERGATLSGGERQRISIARALLKDAPILILDEPTSALDAGTEALIMDALARLMRQRTTFIIAHRLATVQHADRIIVLDQGRIVETGTHQELIGRSGLYARFCALQFQAPSAKSA